MSNQPPQQPADKAHAAQISLLRGPAKKDIKFTETQGAKPAYAVPPKSTGKVQTIKLELKKNG